MKNGWKNVRLPEIAEFSIGLTYSPKDVSDVGTIVLRSSNIQNDRLDLADLVRVTRPIKESLKVAKGDILMCSRNGSKRLVGKTAVIGDLPEHMTFGAFMTLIRSSANPFLSWFFRSDAFRNQLGAGENPVINQITKYMLNAVVVPFPPEKEQERIVAILDEAFEGIATATAHAERNLHNARELFQSVLQSTFEQKGEDWVETTLEDVLKVQPRNGWSPPAAHHSDSGTPVLTLSAVTGFEFRKDAIKYTSAEIDRGKHYWVNNGDLLITRSNTVELVGHVAIASGLTTPTIYPDLIMRMSPDPDRAETKFLYYALRTPTLREVISGRATGANPTMRKINKSAVQTLPLRVPAIRTQKDIVQKLDALAAKTRRLEAVYQRKLDALAELKQSLLQRAFAGVL